MKGSYNMLINYSTFPSRGAGGAQTTTATPTPVVGAPHNQREELGQGRRGTKGWEFQGQNIKSDKIGILKKP